jgi:APA family basic amino acid/polyamine antiporter
MCVALVVGNIIGSGIFLLPASLAPYGMNSVWGWLLTSAGSMALAMVFAGLSRAFPEAGGPQEYTRFAFGDVTSFLVIWGYWISNWVGNAAIATAATSYFSSLFPLIDSTPGAAPAMTIALVWILTAVNLYGVRTANQLQMATAVLKLVPLLAVVGLGLWLFFTRSAQLQNAHLAATKFSLDGVTAAAALTLWAMLGLESAAVVARTVRDPERSIPRASLLGTALSAAIFIIACTTVMALIPGDKLAQSHAPFADAVGMFWGSAAAHWLALFAAISCVGALNGWTFLNAQLTSQMAHSGLFPQAMGRESARGTPSTSLWVNSVLTSVLVLMNYGKSVVAVFNFMILLSTTACLVMYLLCSFALLWLLQNGRLQASRGRVAGLAITGSLGTLYSLWTLYGAGREALLWGAGLLLAGLPLYAALGSSRRAATR